MTHFYPNTLYARPSTRRALSGSGFLLFLGIFALASLIFALSANGIGRIVPEGSPFAVVAQLESELEDARNRRADLQVEAAGRSAERHLVTLLSSSNPAVREHAAGLLGVIGSPRVTNDVVRLLNEDTSVDVRRAAAGALGELKDSHAVNALEHAAVSDPALPVRETAAEALADMGVHWAKAVGSRDTSVPVFAVAPGHPERVYIAELNRLAMSRDGGATWTAWANPLPSHVSTLAISPTNPNVIYAGVDSLGIYKSADNGATWSAINDGLGLAPGVRLRIMDLAIHPENAEHIFTAHGIWIGTSRVELIPLGVMESWDGGTTWHAFDIPGAEEGVSRLSVKSDTLYALAGDRVISVDLAMEDEL